ncbi:hypothetical protein [Streptomyces sp. NPDC006879]|uniref:hypothetical protein n=1 Tax=Streptomyces sp. NPDC006879 TaxID=3364767 RepID=UPI00367D0695
MAPRPRTLVHVREGEPEDTLPLVRQGAVDLAPAYHFDGPLPVGPGSSSAACRGDRPHITTLVEALGEQALHRAGIPERRSVPRR